MVTLEQAVTMAAAFPETVEGERHGRKSWSVGKQAFAWVRPFSKADIKRFGDTPPPEGPILAVRVADLHDKEAVLASGQPGVFDIPHFDGYAAVLIQLKAVRKRALSELLLDAWLACAPEDLAAAYLAQQRLGRQRS
jgi:hypothetical protein